MEVGRVEAEGLRVKGVGWPVESGDWGGREHAGGDVEDEVHVCGGRAPCHDEAAMARVHERAQRHHLHVRRKKKRGGKGVPQRMRQIDRG